MYVNVAIDISVRTYRDPQIPPDLKPTKVESKPDGLEVLCEFFSMSSPGKLYFSCLSQGRHLFHTHHFTHGHG